MKPKGIRKKRNTKKWSIYKIQYTRLGRSPKQKYGLHIKPNIYKRNGLDIKPTVSTYSMNRSKSPQKIKWSVYKAQYIVLPISTATSHLIDPFLQHHGAPPNPGLLQLQPAKRDPARAKAYNMCLSQSLNCKVDATAMDDI